MALWGAGEVLILARHLSQLPNELRGQIVSCLHPSTDVSLECSRTLSSAEWRDLLFCGSSIPWLWNLDPPFLVERRQHDLPAYYDDVA